MNTEEQRAKIRASWEKKATPGPVNRFLGEIFNVPIVILAFLVGVFAVGGGAVNLHFHPAYIVESFVCVAAPAVLIAIFYSLYLLWKKRFRGSVPFFILWAIISFVGNIYVINMLADTSPATPKLADIILDYGPQCGKGSKGCIQIVLPDSFPLPFHITDNESVYTVDRYTNPIKLGLTKAIVLTHKGFLGLPWYEGASARLTNTNTIPADLEIPIRQPLWMRLLYLVVSVGVYLVGLYYYKAPPPLGGSKYPESGILTGFIEYTFVANKVPLIIGICIVITLDIFLFNFAQTKVSNYVEYFFFYTLITIIGMFIIILLVSLWRDVPRMIIHADGIRQLSLFGEQWVHWSSILQFYKQTGFRNSVIVCAQIIGDKISPNLREKQFFNIQFDYGLSSDALIAQLNKFQENYFRAHPEEKRDMRVSKI